MRVNCCGNLDGEPRDMRKWEREDVCYTYCGNLSGKLSGKTCFHDGNGNGNGRLYHTVGMGNNGSEKHGGTGRVYILYVGIDSTTDSRPAPVHLGNSRPIVTCVKPCNKPTHIRSIFNKLTPSRDQTTRESLKSPEHSLSLYVILLVFEKVITRALPILYQTQVHHISR